MKKNETKQDRKLTASLFSIVIILMLHTTGIYSQENDSTKTLFKSSIRVSEIWTPEIKLNSIQEDIGTLVGFYGGVALNRTFLIGISGGVNLGHPRVNYGYFGIIGQYIYKPQALVHFSTQILLAHGSTKDYENPKSGLFDNFWNISGAGFYMAEPGINLEINLSRRLTFVTGISYRYVRGLDETDENVSITHVTNHDLSGLNFNIGLKFGKEKRTDREK
jgi:hypothetical protein